jgi:hypothetical protein
MKHYSPYQSPGSHDFDCVTAGNNELMRQSQMTANTYMGQAIDDIDDKLGDGYASKHPELIAAYMQTAAIDLGSAIIARTLEKIGMAADSIAGVLDRQQD